MKKYLVVFAVFLAAIGTAGQVVPVTDDKAPLVQNYRIGVGDIIDVTVLQNQQLSRTGIRVNNTGGIQLPMLDTDLPAACLTERELADRIRDLYKKYLLEPHVNVTVREFNAPHVAFIGAVNSPGRFQLQRPVRLLELMTFVNGAKENASDSIKIIRNRRLPSCRDDKLILPEDVDDELITVSLADTLRGGPTSDTVIRPGDIIRLDEAEVREAFLVGNVKSAQKISLKDPVTLTQAIAMAGGFTDGANTEKIVIRRRPPGSATTVDVVVNLKEISRRKKEDVTLEPNDIIEVPGPSGGKKFLRDFMRILMPSMGNLPILVVQ